LGGSIRCREAGLFFRSRLFLRLHLVAAGFRIEEFAGGGERFGGRVLIFLAGRDVLAAIDTFGLVGTSRDGDGHADLEARNLQAKGEATKVAEKIDGRNVVILRQASESGQLFGSVSIRDIIASFEHDKVTISRSQVMLDAPIKTIGKHSIAIAVHPEVEVGVTVTVARSADEAERINRGEDISTRNEDRDAAAEAIAAAGEFFDPEARHEPAQDDTAAEK